MRRARFRAARELRLEARERARLQVTITASTLGMSTSQPAPSEPPDAAELELVDSEPGRFRVAVWHNVSFLLWSDQATQHAVQKLRRVTQLLIARNPRGHSNVSFVLKGVAPPTPEARVAFAQAFNDRRSTLRCMTTITEGDGFWASTMRSAVTSMRMASSQELVLRMHNTIEEAAAWLPAEHAERTGVKLEVAELEAALRRFRHEL
jgi:hypothetical protein